MFGMLPSSLFAAQSWFLVANYIKTINTVKLLILELCPIRGLINRSHGVTGVCKSNKIYVDMSKKQKQN